MLIPLILTFISSFPSNVPLNISKNAIENEVNQKVHQISQGPVTFYNDTLLSPIESMFIKITHKNYLRQVGYSSLRNRGNAQNVDLMIPPHYRFDIGDEIIVYMTGSLENTVRCIVDKSGMIFLPGIGTVNAAGLTLHELEEKLNTLAGEKWSNVKITISPGRIHGIKVYLTGEVYNPGAYVLRAHTTLIDLILLAGGILKTGTLRNIHVIHTDGTTSSVDLYPYIFGGKAKLPHLNDGDIVVVSTFKDVIAVDGCVHRKGLYEINKKGTTLRDILSWAGVLPFSQHRAEIHRIKEDSIQIFSVSSKDFKKVILMPGDYVFVPYARLNKGGYVFIKGNVKNQGYYTYHRGMKLSNLIKKAGGFLYPPYRELLIFRRDTLTYKIISVNLNNTTSFVLHDADSVIVFKQDVINQKEPITINGYVENPGLIEWSKNLSVKKAVLSALPRENANLESITVYSKRSAKVMKFSKNNWDSFYLLPGDIVYVPEDTLKQNEIHVFVKGEVKYPGIYTLKKGSLLKDAIKVAGGLKDNAYKDGIYIKRTLISREKNASLTNATLYNILTFKEDTSPNIPPYISKIISSRLENIIPSDTSIPLLNGDTIIVPQYTPYIYITGAVLKPYTTLYEPALSIKKVLKNAPLHPNANSKKAFAISINGKIHHKDLRPGDIIFVPFKTKHKSSMLKDLATMSTIIYQVALGAYIIHQITK